MDKANERVIHLDAFHRGIETAVNEHPINFGTSGGAALPVTIREIRAWVESPPDFLKDALIDASEREAYLTGFNLGKSHLPYTSQSDEEMYAEMEEDNAKEEAACLRLRMSVPDFPTAQQVHDLLGRRFRARARGTCVESLPAAWEVTLPLSIFHEVRLWVTPDYMSVSIRSGSKVVYAGECNPNDLKQVVRVLSNTLGCLHG